MTQLTADFYSANRRKLMEQLPATSVILIAGNSEVERGNDAPYAFHQSANMSYLCGVTIPDAVLLMTANPSGGLHEQLLVPKLHPFMEIWEGRSNRLDELAKLSGISDVVEYDDYEQMLAMLVKDTKQVYIDMPSSHVAQPAAWRLWRTAQSSHNHVELEAINPTINKLRLIKTDEELKLIQAAIKHTNAALEAMEKLIVPGVSERELSAEFARLLSAQGLELSFPSVVSAGKNSCTIHHAPDATKVQAGDLVLFDVGAEVAGYAADVARTYCAGAMSARQQAVYEAVQQLQAEAIALMKPGVVYKDYEQQVAELMIAQLVALGVYKNKDAALAMDAATNMPVFRRYYPHRTSHFLGLEVHDVGESDVVFAPGMVLTCEPGMYLHEEGIGVRIEDDVVITETGNRVLSF